MTDLTICQFLDIFDAGEFAFESLVVQGCGGSTPTPVPNPTPQPSTPVQFKVFTSAMNIVTEQEIDNALPNYTSTPIRVIFDNPDRYLIVAHTTNRAEVQSIFNNVLDANESEMDIIDAPLGDIYDASRNTQIGPYTVQVVDLQSYITSWQTLPNTQFGIFVGGRITTPSGPSTPSMPHVATGTLRQKDFDSAKRKALGSYNPDIYPEVESGGYSYAQEALANLIAHYLSEYITRTTGTPHSGSTITQDEGLTSLRVGSLSWSKGRASNTTQIIENAAYREFDSTVYGREFYELTTPYDITIFGV